MRESKSTIITTTTTRMRTTRQWTPPR
jgi:hypothetical protein